MCSISQHTFYSVVQAVNSNIVFHLLKRKNDPNFVLVFIFWKEIAQGIK